MICKYISFKTVPGILSVSVLTILLLTGTVGPANSAVTVVKSSNLKEFEQASNIISEQLRNRQETVITMQLKSDTPEEEERFWRVVSESTPQLVVTVGTRATRSAMKYCGKLPIIFTMVLDQLDKNQTPGGNPDFSGITISIPIVAQFEYLKKILPDARRLGYIYSSGSENDYENVRKVADKYGLRLFAQKVDSERDILDALRRIMPEIDVFWLPPDKLVWQYIVFRFVVTECFRKGVPVISVYRSRAEAGIPIALGVDYDDIGRQTADLVIKRLKSGKFASPVIDYPRKLVIYVNRGVLDNLNLKIPDDVLEQTVPVKSGR